MDPSATLTEIRRLVAEGMDGSDAELFDRMSELLDSFDGLDGWLSRGGFLPEAWQS